MTGSSSRSPSGGRHPERITVLHSLAPPDSTTKYVDQIVDGADPRVDLRFFTWKAALGGRYDVFHVHWPELTVRGRSRTKRFLRRRAVDALIVLLRLRRIPLVRTVHNVVPHEGGGAPEMRTLAKYDRATTLFIRLNSTTPIADGASVVTIPHGHYKDQYAAHATPDPEKGRLLYFGIIREYKRVDHLMEVFCSLDRPDLVLRIVGSPSIGQREIVERGAAGDARISISLSFVDDVDLVREIGRAELVVLPYREMHNSGAILAALSIGRPILASASESNDRLSDEVGHGWIFTYHGELTAQIIEETLAEVRENGVIAPPRLDARDLAKIGAEHHAAYRQAIDLARARA